MRSCLGWSTHGGSVSFNSKRHFNVNHVSSEDVLPSQELEEFWQIESCGTVREKCDLMSVKNRKALKIIDTSIPIVDGHYQMGLPWRQKDPHLPFNRTLAKSRLQALKGDLTAFLA